MRFVDIAAGETAFVDANPLVYHVSADPTLGPACHAMMGRIARQEFTAVTTTHIVAEMAHRLMTIEACAVFGWPVKGIAARLGSHSAEVRRLTVFRQAIDDVSVIGIQLLTVLPMHLALAANLIQTHGLLYNDALAVAVMQTNGIVNVASNDADFDRVPGIIRFAPS
jgi:predicted nucleic acid-binding protein